MKQYKPYFEKYNFQEDLPLDLKPTVDSIKVRLDITGNGDFKEISDSFKKDMTVAELIKDLSSRNALKKYFDSKRVDSKIANKKLGELAKTDIVELKVLSDAIEYSGEKL